ncbi:MAG TPA: hypothetical protein VLJ39_12165 [Tepidisphaeraceae bacterium]|jgi:hypothetical protein|nr:hypothetical protein [Tepidisphaeraceae bacterium]
MEYRGKVTGGVVIVEPGVELPDGADVRIEVLPPQNSTLGRRLMKFSGRAKEMPTDMAENHDPLPSRACSHRDYFRRYKLNVEQYGEILVAVAEAESIGARGRDLDVTKTGRRRSLLV